MRTILILLALTASAMAQRLPDPEIPVRTVIGQFPANCCSVNEYRVLLQIKAISENAADMMAAIDTMATAGVDTDKASYRMWKAHFEAEIARLDIAGNIPVIRHVIRGIAHANCIPNLKRQPLGYDCKMLPGAEIPINAQ
jgi:hypothetical protein